MKHLHVHIILVAALAGIFFYLVHLLGTINSLETLTKKANAQFLGCSQITRGSTHAYCVYWSPKNPNIVCPYGTTKQKDPYGELCATGAEQPPGSCCLPNPVTPTPTPIVFGKSYCEKSGGRCFRRDCPRGGYYTEDFGKDPSCSIYSGQFICCMPSHPSPSPRPHYVYPTPRPTQAPHYSFPFWHWNIRFF